MSTHCEECGREKKYLAGSFCDSCIKKFVAENDKAHAKEQKRQKEEEKKLKPKQDREYSLYRTKAEIDLAIEQGKIACKNANYFHNHPTYDFNKK